MLARGRLAIRLTLSKIPSRLVMDLGILDWVLALVSGSQCPKTVDTRLDTGRSDRR